MIDDEHWRAIVEACDNDRCIEHSREPLEQAICEFRQAQSVVLSMKDSARRRDQWKAVQTATATLIKNIQAVECWDPPNWGGDAGDNSAKEYALEQIDRLIVRQADFCVDEHNRYVRGPNKPESAKLYNAVCQVWSKMGRSLSWTDNGPFERFFRAVLTPVLGDETPKGTGIRDIVRPPRKNRRSKTSARKTTRIARRAPVSVA